MVCYIFGAGQTPREIPTPAAGDLVIAADAGLSVCRERGIEPDLTVGDFDSLGEIPAGTGVVRLPVEKDETDMAAAVRLGEARGYRVFYLFGGTGGRPDHTYANYQLLAALAERGEQGILFGAEYSAAAISDGSSLTFPIGAGQTLSVFAVGGEADGVTERGVAYPLAGATLSPSHPLGVSNSRLTGERAVVSVTRGTLLVFWEGHILPDFS